MSLVAAKEVASLASVLPIEVSDDPIAVTPTIGTSARADSQKARPLMKWSGFFACRTVRAKRTVEKEIFWITDSGIGKLLLDD
jgi:hypothetical protein